MLPETGSRSEFKQSVLDTVVVCYCIYCGWQTVVAVEDLADYEEGVAAYVCPKCYPPKGWWSKTLN